jgi:co-chaperonin GroES (HSP10)
MSKSVPLNPVIECTEIIPLHKTVIVKDMFFGETINNSGIILLDDDKNERGIHPRYAEVYAIGPECKTDIKIGQWILIEHGRWTRGFDINIGNEDITIRGVDPKAILGVFNEKPIDGSIEFPKDCAYNGVPV